MSITDCLDESMSSLILLSTYACSWDPSVCAIRHDALLFDVMYCASRRESDLH